MTELAPAAESRDAIAAAEPGHRALPLGRRLPGDALPRRRALAAQRGRLPAEARARLERLRRLDHGRRARACLAEARLRRRRRRPGLPGRGGRRRSAALAGRTIDFPAIALGLLLPGVRSPTGSPAPTGKHLFGSATLQDLPDEPRFVFNATNLQSGVLWRFSKPYMRDYRVGEVEIPDGRSGDGRRRLVGVPAVPLARRPEARRGRVTRRDRATCSAPPFTTRPSSPTAASTTTSASRRSGSATRRSSSATAAAT